VLGNGFAQDARLLVMVEGRDGVPNPMVEELRPLTDYFTSYYWKGAAPSAHLYRPLTVLSFALTRRLLGMPLGDDALAQHAVDLLLHVLATAVVFGLLRALQVRRGPALLATLVFGVHALHAEAIASVVGRAELLAFVGGGAGALLAMGAGRFGRGHLTWLRLLAAAGCFFAAFAAKESALPWLVFAPLLGAARAWRRRALDGAGVRGEALRVGLCALPGAVLFLVLRAAVLAPLVDAPAVEHAVNPLHDADPRTRVATATVVWAYGLWKTVWPFWSVSDYGGQTFARRDDVLAWPVLGAAVVLAAVLVLTVCGARRSPLAGLAGACFLGFGFATSNLAFPIGTIFAERLGYTPSLALSLLLVPLVESAWGRIVAGVAVVWCAASAWALAARLPDWRDDQTLLLRDVEANPLSARLHGGAADCLRAHGDLAGAVAHAREAVALDPDYAGAWSNLGALLLASDDPAGAEEALRRGLLVRSQNAISLRLLRLNLGRALLARAQPEAALPELEEAMRLSPTFLPTWEAMLDALAALGMDDRVRAMVDAGAAAAPGSPLWPLHRGLLALKRGDAVAAERELQAALAAGGEDARTRAALVQAQAQISRPRR